jgi:apoptosis-inducing factor 2
MASDIKAVHPMKKVTLLHSRRQLLPRFDMELHREGANVFALSVFRRRILTIHGIAIKGLELLDVNIILGERLDMSSIPELPANGKRVVRTSKGKSIPAELLVCHRPLPTPSVSD